MMQEPIAISPDGKELTIAFMPKLYIWKPRKDITAYELALAVPILTSHGYDLEQAINNLPVIARRHFEEA